MKRYIILSIIFVVLPQLANSQDIQLERGKDETKLVSETELHFDKGMTLLYTEVLFDKNKTQSAYVQLFHERKWWDAPFLIHAEIRTYLQYGWECDNTYFVGGAWESLSTEKSFITTELLYRHDGKSNVQLTFAYGWWKKRWLFSGYVDFYGMDKLYLFSENKIFYNVYKNLHIGANLEVGMHTRDDKSFSVYPFAILRYNF